MDTETPICGVVDWGLQPYARVWGWQKELVAARKAGVVPDVLLLGEHPPVITLGRNARRAHLRLPDEELNRRGVEVYEIERGGDVTYHGPGQLVGYPILNLVGLRKDVVWYIRMLEEVLIRAASEFRLNAARKLSPVGKRQFYTGVWVNDQKLAAIGVHIARWVTSHGFAFNVTTDLSYFDLIVPCGIPDKGVTSLERLLRPSRKASTPVIPSSAGGGARNLLLNKQIPRLRPAERDSARDDKERRDLMAAVKAAVVKHFGEVFEREMRPVEPETLEAWSGAQQAAAS